MKKEPQTLHERISARGKKALMKTCRHQHTQISWVPTHFRGNHGSGSGFFEVGKFDTVETCLTCGHTETLAQATLPLCQSCKCPMESIKVSSEEKTHFSQKQVQDWEKYCARKERVEAEEERRKALNPPPPDPRVPVWFVPMSGNHKMFRLQEGFERRSVSSYQCTNTNCRRHGRIKFLYTPGD